MFYCVAEGQPVGVKLNKKHLLVSVVVGIVALIFIFFGLGLGIY